MQWSFSTLFFKLHTLKSSLASRVKKRDMAKWTCFAALDCVKSRFFLPGNQTRLTEHECPDVLLQK